MRAYLLFAVLLTTGLRAAQYESVTAPPKLIVSIRRASVDPKTKDGYYLYFEDPGEYDSGKRVVAYEYRRDRLFIKYAPGLLEEDYLFLALAQVGFEAFDYEGEKQKIKAGLTDAKRRGLARHLADTGADGISSDKFTIEVRLSAEAMIFSDINPRHQVAVYALYSERFKKLKQVLDLVAQTYGYSQMGI